MFKKILWVFLISIVPVVELRGAIPVGAASGLPFYWNFLAAVAGNMLPVPFILLFIPAVLRFMKRHRIFPRLCDFIERKGMRGVEKLQAKSREGTPASEIASLPEETDILSAESDASAQTAAEIRQEKKMIKVTFGVCLGLFAFVAVPLPGTGAWTGALVASLCGLPKRYALPTIFLGVLCAGVIMTLASYGVVAAFQVFAK